MSSQHARLLIVDDDPSTLATYSRILALEGYEVTTAIDGSDGLQHLRSETYDLVLTDHRMPGLTGLELIAEAMALEKSPSIFMYTALGSSGLEAAARRLGAVGYSDGLLDVEGLLTAVKNCHRSHQTLSKAGTASLGATDFRLRRALKFIRRGYRSRKLSLGRTARVAGLSPSYLDKLLERQTEMSFTEHRRLIRVEAARCLLKTSLLEKQIAPLVGYADARGLRRDFRHVLGTSPITYRRAGTNPDRK
jgi:YesN/AraC family two-component response regulator